MRAASPWHRPAPAAWLSFVTPRTGRARRLPHTPLAPPALHVTPPDRQAAPSRPDLRCPRHRDASAAGALSCAASLAAAGGRRRPRDRRPALGGATVGGEWAPRERRDGARQRGDAPAPGCREGRTRRGALGGRTGATPSPRRRYWAVPARSGTRDPVSVRDRFAGARAAGVDATRLTSRTSNAASSRVRGCRIASSAASSAKSRKARVPALSVRERIIEPVPAPGSSRTARTRWTATRAAPRAGRRGGGARRRDAESAHRRASAARTPSVSERVGPARPSPTTSPPAAGRRINATSPIRVRTEGATA